MNPYHREVIARLTDLCPLPPPELELRFQPMFGGLGGYVRERIFFVLHSEGPALKFAKPTQDDLMTVSAEARHLSWTRLYLTVPDYIWHDDDLLPAWMQLSIDDVLAWPSKKKKR
ncbi:MAG: TfoX/Sxy family protein [Pleurocapsa minor GSE-CHR-MK-17-07R]|jgi:TfoX/Sxy family transcriptional regulator of competence genes|nr:TfoX/Sxy family protein [Pleurocapsa minor GSE-CHR-MK 17-07R]